jgi:dipeptidyl aminopeptidase/acylaminoacyl peptidase
LVVQVVGATDGDVFALVDLKTGGSTLLGAEYKGVAPEELAPVRPISYRAADGRQIDAYLTLPKGRDAKALPLVVLPHGGPAARDEPGFDWWAQALASRGYAVLQPQFRGSGGLGVELLSAGYGEWGRKMQTDLSDGVRDLAAKGIADPKRVCIVGASYGGYAALAGATLDAGVYRCAVAVAGISDLHRFLAWERGSGGSKHTSVMRYWDRYMGAKSPDDPALDEISPAKRLEKLSAPILLIHGRDDTVVPIEQSQIMLDALKKAGKPAEMVTLQSEDHWLSRSETRLQMLEATVKFLEANNPPG